MIWITSDGSSKLHLRCSPLSDNVTMCGIPLKGGGKRALELSDPVLGVGYETRFEVLDHQLVGRPYCKACKRIRASRVSSRNHPFLG